MFGCSQIEFVLQPYFHRCNQLSFRISPRHFCVLYTGDRTGFWKLWECFEASTIKGRVTWSISKACHKAITIQWKMQQRTYDFEQFCWFICHLVFSLSDPLSTSMNGFQFLKLAIWASPSFLQCINKHALIIAYETCLLNLPTSLSLLALHSFPIFSGLFLMNSLTLLPDWFLSPVLSSSYTFLTIQCEIFLKYVSDHVLISSITP